MTTSMQNQYIAKLREKVAGDARVRAAWLEGSLGRGEGDRYSDVDAHLLISEADSADFLQGTHVWLSTIQPLVLFKVMFDGKMLNALTDEGLRLDIWLHTGENAEVRPGKYLPLLDRTSSLREIIPGDTPQTTNQSAVLERHLNEFWRCISLLPTVLGRQEFTVGTMGVSVELGILTEILLIGTGAVRESGVKTLNRYLPEEMRAEIEAALSAGTRNVSAESLARVHLRLAQIVQRRGPGIAAQGGATYPHDLEQTVMRYVSDELRLLGLADCLTEK